MAKALTEWLKSLKQWTSQHSQWTIVHYAIIYCFVLTLAFSFYVTFDDLSVGLRLLLVCCCAWGATFAIPTFRRLDSLIRLQVASLSTRKACDSTLPLINRVLEGELAPLQGAARPKSLLDRSGIYAP